MVSAQTPTTTPTSADAINPATNGSKLAADAASNATQDAQNKYNSVPGLMKQVNEFGTASIQSAGNAVTDAANNLGNIASNTAAQLVNVLGMGVELFGFLSGGLINTGGQVVHQVGSGVGGALKDSGKTVGNSFKEFSSYFHKLGSQTLSMGGNTQAGHLSGQA